MQKLFANLFLLSCILFATSALSATYSPSLSSGRVTGRITESQLNGFLSAGVNAALFDQPLSEALLDLKSSGKIAEVFSAKFSDASISLHPSTDMLSLSVDFGVYKYLTRLKIKELSLNVDGHFRLSPNASDGTVDVDYCLDAGDASVNKVDATFAGVSFDKVGNWLGDYLVNRYVDPEVSSRVKDLGCFPLLSKLSVGFPLLGSDISLQRIDVRTIEDALEVSACPVPRKMIGNVAVIANDPCEQWRYRVTVYTGDWDNSGTSAKVYAQVCGKNSEGIDECIEPVQMPSTTNKNQTASSAIIDSDVRLLDFITVKIWHDNTGSRPGWRLDSANVTVLQPDNTMRSYWLAAHRWIFKSKSPSMSPEIKLSTVNGGRYQFTVHTGDFDNAGTNSAIYARLCGSTDCEDFKLESPENDFGKNSLRTYEKSTIKDLGSLVSLQLISDLSGDRPGWNVDYVGVTYQLNSECSLFGPSCSTIHQANFNYLQWIGEDCLQEDMHNTKLEKNFEVNSSDEGQKTLSKAITTIRYADRAWLYHWFVKTPDLKDAGTDSRIIATVTGCSGDVETFDMDNHDKDDRIRGALDEYQMTRSLNLKGIKNISFSNDNSGNAPGWLLDSVALIVSNFDKETNAGNDGVRIKVNKWLSKSDGLTWTSEDMACPEQSIVPKVTTGAGRFLLRQGDISELTGTGFGYENTKVSLVIGSQSITSSTAVDSKVSFMLPSSMKPGVGSAYVTVNGVSSQSFEVDVKGIQPVFGGIAVSTIVPGDGFQAGFSGVDSESQFYLGDIPLKVIGLTQSTVSLQVPGDMPDGVYALRVVSQGWDQSYSVNLKVVDVLRPILTTISSGPYYRGDTLVLSGSNFGVESDVKVSLGGISAELVSVTNTQIKMVIPQQAIGNSLALVVKRLGHAALYAPMIKVESYPSFFSFDDNQIKWTSDNALLSRDNTNRIGSSGSSLQVHGSGYMIMKSPRFDTWELSKLSHTLSLDIWVPYPQQNPYWYGVAQAYIDVPSAGVNNLYLSDVQLTGLNPGWNTISFTLNSQAYAALSGDYAKAQIRLVINGNQNAQDWRIDNLRFTGNVQPRSINHQYASHNVDMVTTSLFSFDNVEEWSSSQANLSTVLTPREEGGSALGVAGGGYMAVKSREFSTSEITYVSDLLSIDVYVPDPQPNPYWVGTLSLSLSCPSAGIYSRWLGQEDLTHLFHSEYNRLEFPLPADIQNLLKGTNTCQVELDLNVNNGSGQFMFDNMGFTRRTEVAFGLKVLPSQKRKQK